MRKRLTQMALVMKVYNVVMPVGFSPGFTSRLYTEFRSQVFVLMFQLSSKILKFGASSMLGMSTLAALFHKVRPCLSYPLNPYPEKMQAPWEGQPVFS